MLSIDGTMAGDGTLTAMLPTAPASYGQSIYYQSAPDTATFPLVIFNKQSGVPTYSMMAGTPTASPLKAAFEDEIWLIKGISHQGSDAVGSPKSSPDTAEQIAERIRTLLNDQTLSISGVSARIYLRRQSDIDYQELAAGETYVHCGSLFRLTFDPS